MSTPVIHAAFKKGAVGIEIRIFAITKSGKGKARKRSQATIDACPTIWVEGFTADDGDLLFDELRNACRAFAVKAKQRSAAKEAAVPVPPVAHFVTGMSPALPIATVPVGEPAAPQPTEPVVEIRPSRQPVARKGGERSEADEIAEGLALVAAANAQVS